MAHELGPSVVRSKTANGGQVKTGQRMWPGTSLFYPVFSWSGKSVFVRQLRGPHFRTTVVTRRRRICRSKTVFSKQDYSLFPFLLLGPLQASLSIRLHVRIGGNNIEPPAFSGTYSVNPDCTVTDSWGSPIN